MKTEVLIVGAGGAGIAAALEAAQRGAQVTILDPAAEAGGTARGAGGGTFIAGSPLHERLGIQDSPARALEDWLAWGGETVDVEWARRYVEASVSDLYVWLATLGVEWIEVNWHEGNRVPRWHAPRDGGLGVIRALERAARAERRIDWRLGTRATDLVVAGGRVVGALCEGPSGPAEYRAEAVLIASGGFNNNLEMVRRYASTSLPPGSRILLGGGEGACGDGHAMLERIAAQFVNMDAIWMYPYATPDYQDPSGVRGLVLRGLEGDVWVNRQGHRFHNEDHRGGATGAIALLRQDPATCWSIIDARIAARYNVSHPRYRHGATPRRDRLQQLLDESPFIAQGDTLESLAAAGLDGGALRETITAHNRMIAARLETDPDFGRSLRGLETLAEPPFYAIQFFPLARKNLGGVRTNLACQVLDRQDRAIPGLFAAGEVAGMAGGRINGRAALEGTMFGPSLFSGRVAGRSMA